MATASIAGTVDKTRMPITACGSDGKVTATSETAGDKTPAELRACSVTRTAVNGRRPSTRSVVLVGSKMRTWASRVSFSRSTTATSASAGPRNVGGVSQEKTALCSCTALVRFATGAGMPCGVLKDTVTGAEPFVQPKHAL